MPCLTREWSPLDNGPKLQYFNLTGHGEFAFSASAGASAFYGLLRGEAGLDLDIEYTRMLAEIPGTETLTYVSTIYNSLRYRSDDTATRNEREKAMKDAQKKRQELLADGETMPEAQKQEWDLLEKYWETYQEQRPLWKSEVWDAYKNEHKENLNELARKFFQPIFEAKTGAQWSHINLMTVDGEFMRKRAGFKTPDKLKEQLDQKYSIQEYKYTTIQHLEELILINQYKNHQKHAFDYYYYSN
ncbi:hypothetical protein FUAX_55380 (plasmid) [Fulvitalea axinellae]|uniref:Uncharacterized protein n=1 Tax=Fulvitalea axinellae TaxID=1182444 RepID=A0AAU9DIZ9_9BACT|nr:hypothetical protein FUAX_55380 [Fulvitalea axinellae]